MDQQPELLPRIGNFFILVGAGLMMVFIGSIQGNVPKFDYFGFSLIALFLGFILRRRAKPRLKSGRFSTLGKLRGAGKDKKEKSKR
ncbi:MAG: hypothetical protein Q8N45_10610 [Anaerolineales bacterium]|nr:hypothetical protein [Anaerolineales bacterium]